METIEYMCVATKFHLHVCYTEQVTRVKRYFEENCLRLFVVVYKHVI